ncbi:cell growth-regulating nucleolar protein [Sporothrix schenckii 1099-18]|uniref:Cell growth-regulating nucleolar protein n=1 Tax=Sporothrix schenckii 1099-18 TaxID=1397361 RepID=A0A0F2M7X4_SPOSC|nr:cell growth-regulating nucleolar protein [Sporothrix schenckii 1099-18]KJR85793.1 cell growth-regulating nucleolar protein [Sporothrix schenckii 1099-18]
MVHFYGTEYRTHTSCMTEDQKYQGALYKNNDSNNKNKNKKARISPPNGAEEEHHFHPSTPSAPVSTNSSKNNNSNNNKNSIATKKQQVAATPSVKKSNMAAVAQYQQPHHMSHAAYVEDVPEELEGYLVADDDDHRSDDDAPPHAPTPPPAAEGPVNVFDFLVAGATPNASSLGLSHPTVKFNDSADTDVARYEYDANAYLAAADDFSMAGHAKYQQHLAQYGNGPVPTAEPTSIALTPFRTPAPDRAERKKKESAGDKDKDASKKDKKRKRLTLDINDQVMTDAPPVLHSGLTGGLHRLTTKHAAFPPSPESAETPASPLKKSKKSKRSKSRAEPVTNSLFSRLTAGSSKIKTKKRKHRRSASPSGKKHSSHSSSSSSKSHRRHRDAEKDGASTAAPAQKLLEYPGAEKKEDDNGGSGQLIVYKPRADLFLSFVNKGPDSERGCSMNKALKRFHRERSSSGTSLAKPAEEKELFRSLRLRKNDRGEIVLFCVDEE